MFSSHAIYDVLKNCDILHTIPEGHSRKYIGICPLPDIPEFMFSEILYVCPLSSALERSQLVPNCHYVCICDLSDEEASEKLTKNINIFCIRSEHDATRLFYQLQSRYLHLRNWIDRMDKAAHRGCDFQELVDMSEDILRNPIFVQDSAFHLLATSKNYLGPSEIQREYQAKRYHSREFLSRLEAKGRFNTYNNTEGMFISRDHLIEPFDMLGKHKRREGMLALNVGVTCSATPYSPYYAELVETFCDYIFLCDDIRTAKSPESVNRATALIRDIISGEIQGEVRITECTHSISFPFEGPFCLYRLSFDKSISAPSVARELRLALNCPNVFYFANEILVLAVCQTMAEDVMDSKTSDAICGIAEAHSLKCCVSEPFPDLTLLKKAYDQTIYTLSFVHKMASSNKKSRYAPIAQKQFLGRNLYSYREVFIQGIFDFYAENGPCAIDNVIFVSALQKLVVFDKEHDRNLVEILYYYICNERNASKTGDQIHMSRNNVLYHIAKATEILELPLDEHRIRFGLLIAYNLLGIYF